jgi:hypothetical protein
MNLTQWVKSGVKVASVLAVFTVGTAFTQLANAGCGKYQGLGAVRFDLGDQSSLFGSPSFLRTNFIETSDEGGPAPIVGLWHFVYISKGNEALMIPDGAPVDGGNTTWYGDGNELTSSEMRDPATGSICLGVWKRTGEQTYELNHIGLSWDTVAKKLSGPAFIKQSVNLQKSGNKYTGTATITQYEADGKTVATVPVNNILVPLVIHASIVAYRVTLDTYRQTPIVPAP